MGFKFWNWLQSNGKSILVIAVLIYAYFETQTRNDFDIYMSAAIDLSKGENLYTIKYYTWYSYYYDLMFAHLLGLFQHLPIALVKYVWVVLNCFFIYRIFRLIGHWLPIGNLKQNKRNLLYFLAVIFAFRFLKDNLHLGQMTICILYLILEGLKQVDLKQDLKGGTLLAIGISIKLLPLVFLPYLAYRKKWTAFSYTILVLFVVTFLPFLFTGWDFGVELLKARFINLDPTNFENSIDTLERSYHSLTTLCATLFLENDFDKYALPLKRNVLDVSHATLKIIILAVRLFFIAGTLYFLHSKPFQQANSKAHQFYEISYLLLVIPLIFPHQQHYAFLFAIPAVTYLLFTVINSVERKNGFLKIALLLIFIVFNSTILLGTFREYYDHYKIITYAALGLVVLLALYAPWKKQNSNEIKGEVSKNK